VAYPYIGVSGPAKYINNITKDVTELGKDSFLTTFSLSAEGGSQVS
jgi:hypothetical protein